MVPLPELGGPDFLSLGSDQPVRLPNGEQVEVYAEVGLAGPRPDVSLSVVEYGRVFGVRASWGVVVTFTTVGGLEVLLQIGTGAWEE